MDEGISLEFGGSLEGRPEKIMVIPHIGHLVYMSWWGKGRRRDGEIDELGRVGRRNRARPMGPLLRETRRCEGVGGFESTPRKTFVKN